jgi:hypothetical protein
MVVFRKFVNALSNDINDDDDDDDDDTANSVDGSMTNSTASDKHARTRIQTHKPRAVVSAVCR